MKGRVLFYLILSIVVEVVALGLAIASGGIGHGSYVFAVLLFPIEMIIGSLVGPFVWIPLLIALFHYPALILPLLAFSDKRRIQIYLAVVASVHFVLAVLIWMFAS